MKARTFLESAGPLIGLAFVAIVFGFLVGPQFFRGTNLELIARQTAIVCTAANVNPGLLRIRRNVYRMSLTMCSSHGSVRCSR